jgi:RNA polymerase sigma factor (sigma-70 family)
MSLVPVSEDPLADLMRSAQAGDRTAYEALLDSITPMIRRFVHRQRGFLGSEAVEDLIQDVLLSVHAVRHTYDPKRPFAPWLFAIVRNRVADRARRYARTEAHEVVVDELDVTFPAEETNFLNERQDDERLRRAIEALPTTQRRAIELMKLRELSLKEAAAETGLTVGALKVATHRAMSALRRLLVVKG